MDVVKARRELTRPWLNRRQVQRRGAIFAARSNPDEKKKDKGNGRLPGYDYGGPSRLYEATGNSRRDRQRTPPNDQGSNGTPPSGGDPAISFGRLQTLVSQKNLFGEEEGEGEAEGGA